MGLFGKKKKPAEMTFNEADAVMEQALNAYEAKNYKKALLLFLQAAEYGFDSAQFNCGLMYYKGLGTKQDYAEAFQWFLKAARKDNQVAQYRCALMFEKGEGISEPSLSNARGFYRKSAESGYLPALLKCGKLCLEGEGGKPTPEQRREALMWFEKAAEQGDVDAQMYCAGNYEHGVKNVIEIDLEKALKWYEKAAKQGDVDALAACSNMYYYGRGTAVDKEKAMKLREEWQKLKGVK